MATKDNDSLLDSLRRLTGQVAGGTFELARNTATMTAMFGENWLRNTVLNNMEPERLEAMAEAGHFLRDARETAGSRSRTSLKAWVCPTSRFSRISRAGRPSCHWS